MIPLADGGTQYDWLKTKAEFSPEAAGQPGRCEDMARTARSERVPLKMREKFDEIVALTDEFCHERLNDEYRQLVREATAALCRKRPSPLMRGRIDI